MNTFNGLRVIESRLLEQDGEPRQVRKTWRARLCSWPWRPWQATTTVVPKVPYQGAFRLDKNTVVMHPDTIRKLRRLTEPGAENPHGFERPL